MGGWINFTFCNNGYSISLHIYKGTPMSEYIQPLLTFIASIIVAIIAAIPGIKALKVQQAERDAHAKDVENQITERVLERANAEIQLLSDRLSESQEEYNRRLVEGRKACDSKIALMELEIKRLQQENIALRKENIQLQLEIERLKKKLGCAE